MFVNGQLESAQIEYFTLATRPAASSMYHRIIWLTDSKVLQVSNGTSWDTVGASESVHQFQLNGDYSLETFPMTEIDGLLPIPYDATITGLWAYSNTQGSGGTTELDLKVGTSGGAFASLLSTTPKFTSAASSNVWTDSGAVIGAQAGVTKPVLSSTSLTAGQALRMDVIQGMSGTPADCGLIIFYRPV